LCNAAYARPLLFLMSKSSSSKLSLSSSSHSHKKLSTKPPVKGVPLGKVLSVAAPSLRSIMARVNALSASSSVMKEDYVDVKSGKSAPSKWSDVDEQAMLQAQIDALKQSARLAIGKDRTKVKLWTNGITSNTTAGAELKYNVGLSPTVTSEWSSMAQLYDECRVTDIKVHHCLSTLISSAGTPNLIWAVGYDSTRNTAPTSLADVLESTKHQMGAWKIAGYTNLEARSPNGMHTLNCPQKMQPVANASAVTGGNGIVANFPGEWFETNNAASLVYTVGYFRAYCEAPTNPDTIQIQIVVEYTCEFRERT